jgi:hypothetical protein
VFIGILPFVSLAKSVKNLCEAEEWIVKSGYLVSPLYPQMYPKGLDCACRISSNTTGTSIGIQTLEYRLSDEASCADWLYVITDFSSEQLCGTLARHFVGKDISLLLHTKKDGFKGFMLHFEGRFPLVLQLAIISCRFPLLPFPYSSE